MFLSRWQFQWFKGDTKLQSQKLADKYLLRCFHFGLQKSGRMYIHLRQIAPYWQRCFISLLITTEQAMISPLMLDENTWVFKWAASYCPSALNCRLVSKCTMFGNLLFSYGGRKVLCPQSSFLREKVFHPAVFMLHRHCNPPADSFVFPPLCLSLSSKEHFVPLGRSWSICQRRLL